LHQGGGQVVEFKRGGVAHRAAHQDDRPPARRGQEAVVAFAIREVGALNMPQLGAQQADQFLGEVLVGFYRKEQGLVHGAASGG